MSEQTPISPQDPHRLQYLEEAHRFHQESLGQLASLGDFQTSIKECLEPAKVLSVTRNYIRRLVGFHTIVFAMVRDEDLSFDIINCDPPADLDAMERIMHQEIKAGTFSWALRQNHSVVIRNKERDVPVLFHVLGTRSRVLGMFFGTLSDPDIKSSGIGNTLLSIILQGAAYALENLALYNEINKYNENLEQQVQKRTLELSIANEELIKAKKLESVALLAGGIAHDFNNMLSIIMGNISMAKRAVPAEEKMFKRLESIEKASIRAQDLTHQLLTFAKGGVPIKKTSRVQDLLRDSIELALRGSNIICEQHIASNLFAAEIDPAQMRQALVNLVQNAEQSKPKSGKIQIKADNLVLDGGGVTHQAGKFVRISVIDDGVGISKEHLQQIFDPYFTTKPGKSGLGLALTYSIVKKHDGYITVESDVGKGSTFHVFIPASQKPIEAAISVAPGAQTPKSKKGRILIMDDEEAIRDMVGSILTENGHEVAYSKNGTEAIDLYKKAKETGKPFDVVIMDLTIPGGMGGKDCIQKLAEYDPNVKAIVSSGYSSDPVMADHSKYRFREVLAKPYQYEDLCRVVDKVMVS
jgi:signal transduction histidine kinase/CheY-like chemotaxis protein